MAGGIFYVYALKRKTTGEVFYIGKGKGLRWKAHAKRSCNAHAAAIIRRDGAVCEIVWDGLSEADAFVRERFLIRNIGRLDLGTGPLVNATSGGDGVSNPGLETRAKIGSASIARWNNPTFRATVSASAKALWDNPAYRARGEARWDDPARRAAMSAANKANWDNPTYRGRKIAAIAATKARNTALGTSMSQRARQLILAGEPDAAIISAIAAQFGKESQGTLVRYHRRKLQAQGKLAA